MRTRLLGLALILFAALGGISISKALYGRFWNHDTARAERAAHVAPMPPAPPIPPFPRIPGFDASADGRVMIDRSFAVSAGQSLTVDVQHADLEIETGPVSEARIVVTLDSPDMEAAVEKFEAMRFETGAGPSGVWLRSNPMDGLFSGNFWSRVRMSIRVRAVIPEEFDLDLASTHGDVQLASLRGDVSLRTTHGDVTARDLAGERISIRSTHGDVHASTLSAPILTVETTHGDLAFGRVASGRFDARTTHSDITVTSLVGSAEVSTTHGDVAMNVEKTDGIRVQTTHGNVVIDLPEGHGAELELSGDPVHVEGSADFRGERSRKRVEGTLNGGGSRISVSTSFGSVEIG